MDEDRTQELQDKVDTVKTLSLINNAHNLSPPIKKDEDDGSQIAIIRALDSYPRIQEIYLEAQGLMFDQKQKKTIQMSRPYMNKDFAKKLVAILLKYALADWSNIEEEMIPKFQSHFFNTDYPPFTLWHEEGDLDPKDFNYVSTTLQMFLVASFGKGKGGKQLNVIGKTYSEDLLGRVMSNEKNKKQEGFLDKINPFRKMN